MNATRRTDHTTADTSRTTTDPRRDSRPTWGRSSRLGGGPGRLIGVSLALGGLLALVIGAVAFGLASLREHPDARFPWIMGAAMASTSLPIGAGVAWVFLVDRTTIRGAIRNTEETIEGHWLEKAQAGAFGDLMLVIGVGTFAVGMTGWQPDPALVGSALLLFAAASAVVRYLLQKRRG